MEVDRTPVNELNDDPLAEIEASAFTMLPSSGDVDVGRTRRRHVNVIGLDVLGSEILGDFDITPYFQTGGAIAQAIINQKQKKDQEAQSGKDSAAKLDAVLTADRSATDAQAQALCSVKIAAATPEGASKAAATMKAQADSAVAAQAAAVQDAAALGLSDDGAAKRLDAAQKALTEAAKKASLAAGDLVKSPNDTTKKAAAALAQCRVQAAKETAMKAASQQSTPEKQAEAEAAVDAAATGEENFFTRKVGPLPVWGWGASLLGVTAGALGLRRILRR